MIFREELPPLRYTLEGGDDDGAAGDAAFLTTYAVTLPADAAGKELVLLAPRVAPLAGDLGAVRLATARLEARTRPGSGVNSLLAAAQEFYEVDARAEDFATVRRWDVDLLTTPHGAVVAVLPAVAEAEAAFLGRELVLQLRPLRVVLATPGLSFMDAAVALIATPDFGGAAAAHGVPLAQPPVIVQGAGAAAVSRAQQTGVPAAAVVLRADGPTNHEIVTQEGLRELRTALFRVLQLKLVDEPQVQSSLSTLYV